ncbi:MAG: sugar phosphate isomerase/epimerase family protein [Pirellulaceae bacterium]
MHRRTFTRLAAALPLASALSRPVQAFSPSVPEKNGLGLQLWTVRNQLQEDAAKTLKSVAEAGYKQVELMNVMESSDLVAMAKDNGMKVLSAFINWESIASPSKNTPSVEEIIAKAKDFGLEYIVFGYIGKNARDTADKIKKIAEATNKAASTAKEAGLKLSYHNHSFEFEKLDGGATAFEIFMERFDSKLVNFELDVFWAAIGGWDPIDTLEKLGKRTGQVHLKDLKANTPTNYDEGTVPEDAFQEVGDGTLDMKKIMQVAIENGVDQFHVEQDQSPDPIESIQQSSKYITANLW